MSHPHAQSASVVRLEWGMPGATLLGPDATVVVVVDVLSFTTTVSVAVERGISVHPYAWRQESAASFAADIGATLAVDRRAAGPGEVSLSPSSVRAATGIARLVLPSPNGSAICRQLAGRRVVAASLRNAGAVAAHLAGLLPGGGSVALVPAGERWPDDTLRPAVEDLWGAGAVVRALSERGIGGVSEEARSAAAAYDDVAGDLLGALRRCSSGVELVESGFAADVDVAAEVDASTVVPVLTPDGAFLSG